MKDESQTVATTVTRPGDNSLPLMLEKTDDRAAPQTPSMILSLRLHKPCSSNHSS